MKTASVYHHKDGPGLQVEEVPLWALMIQSVLNFLFPVLTLGHRLCCCGPEWFWRVGWGKAKPGDPDYDPDMPDWLRHSLGHAMYKWGGWLDAGWLWHRTRPVISLPLTAEQLERHFPGDAKWIAELFAEEDESGG